MAKWHSDPNLTKRFHPAYPDDLQVFVHEGNPRLTSCQPELMWVRVIGERHGVYQGVLLNQPHQLETIREGSEILFIASPEVEYPFRVTDAYLAERAQWNIYPCQQCGMPELSDAPSDLIAKVFPNLPADAKLEMFTSLCSLCGGVQIVEAKTKRERSSQ